MNDFLKLVLSMSLSGSIIALILFAVRPFIKERFSKAWQYYIWLVVILRLLLPYSPEVSLIGNLFDRVGTAYTKQITDLATTVPQAGIIQAKENMIEFVPTGVPDEGNVLQTAWKSTVNCFGYAFYPWVLGVLFLFAVKVFQYRSFVCYVKAGSSLVSDKETIALFQKIADEFGIKKKIPLYTNKLIKSPMLIGLLKPAVILPENSLDGNSLNYVFRHELTHFKRLDIWYKWLVQLTVCIHYFNPMMYIIRKHINNLCEFSCDEAISKRLDAAGKMEYGSTLLKMISEDAESKRSVLTTTLYEDKKNLKERLSSILKAGQKPKRVVVFSSIAAAVLCALAVCLGTFSAGEVTQRLPVSALPAQRDEQDIRALVEAFGKTLRMVSLSAPDEVVITSIKENYNDYVMPELLQKWQADPQSAPGRMVSSPWPAHIDILRMEMGDKNQYTVYGEIIEATSMQLANGEVATKRPVTIAVQKVNDRWLISSVTIGEYTQRGSVVYENTRYGFCFYLPETWKGYTIVEEQWEGTSGADIVETGPQLLIRHPDWIQKNPRQDIPIMVFTLEQWNALQEGEFFVSAAPIGPSKLGSNSTYVFALPAHYNYAFQTGFEEVEEILNGNPFWPYRK